MIAIIMINYWFSLLVFVELALMFLFYKQLKITIIESRKIDLVYRSPLFQHFASAV